MTDAVRAAFAKQADWCRRLGGPFTARLCDRLPDLLDPATATGAVVFGWAGNAAEDVVPLRLTGGLHALVRRGRLPMLARHYPPNEAGAAFEEDLRAALVEADAELRPWLDSPPQTNEVARSGVLMAGLLQVAAETGLPLALLELGSSAGLNLRLDHYAHRLGGVTRRPAGAPIVLEPDWEGLPPPDARVEVVSRRGVDLNPLDVTDAATRERLLAYVWPDQPARARRLEAALAAAAADPPPIDRGDAAAWVEAQVAPRPGAATVVFHSIAFQYFPDATRARIASHMERQGAAATRAAPLAWLRFELDDFAGGQPPTLRLRLWPDGTDRLLAVSHPHGAFLRWAV
jgi:hypothetical protein